MTYARGARSWADEVSGVKQVIESKKRAYKHVRRKVVAPSVMENAEPETCASRLVASRRIAELADCELSPLSRFALHQVEPHQAACYFLCRILTKLYFALNCMRGSLAER